MGIRSFLAFELPVEIKSEITSISGQLKKKGLPVRWVKPDNIHLTLAFLGSVEEDKIVDIADKITMQVKDCPQPEVRLNGIGVFPDLKRPRVIWVGLDGDIMILSILRNKLQNGLKGIGFKPEKRPFKPHLTLGRFKNSLVKDPKIKEAIAEHYHAKGDLYYLKELVLFKSDLRPKGPIYTKMNVWPLEKT